MVKKTKTRKKYTKHFSVGIRIELPTRMISRKDLVREYKKRFNQSVIFDVNHEFKVLPFCVKEVILARPGEEKSMGSSSFSILLNMGDDLDSVMRLVKIINILGNDRIIREKIKMFFIGKSTLNMLPELNSMMDILKNIEQIIPGFIETAWLVAPEAKLR